MTFMTIIQKQKLDRKCKCIDVVLIFMLNIQWVCVLV